MSSSYFSQLLSALSTLAYGANQQGSLKPPKSGQNKMSKYFQIAATRSLLMNVYPLNRLSCGKNEQNSTSYWPFRMDFPKNHHRHFYHAKFLPHLYRFHQKSTQLQQNRQLYLLNCHRDLIQYPLYHLSVQQIKQECLHHLSSLVFRVQLSTSKTAQFVHPQLHLIEAHCL